MLAACILINACGYTQERVVALEEELSEEKQESFRLRDEVRSLLSMLHAIRT